MEHQSIPAYNGEDMVGYMMEKGFKLSDDPLDKIKSITNVRSCAVVVTDRATWLVEPCRDVGFCIKVLAHHYW